MPAPVGVSTLGARCYVARVDENELFAEVPELDEAQRRALSAAEQWVGGDVAGVGIGETDSGAPCLTVYSTDLTGAVAKRLPATVEGLPVRVVSTPPFTAQSQE